MYAVYTYNAGASKANVCSDITSILTGTTDKSTLSSSCNQTSTSIFSTVAAGWTMHDSAAGTDYKILKSLNADGSTYKYFGIEIPDPSYFRSIVAEDWNATTHSGTNAYRNTSYNTSIDCTNGGTLYIHSSNRDVVIISWTSGGWQTPNNSMCFEVSSSIIPTSYPKHVLVTTANDIFGGNGNTMTYIPRLKYRLGSGDLTGSGAGLLIGPITAVQDHNTLLNDSNSTIYRDAADTIKYQFMKLGICNGAVHIGEVLADVYVSGKGPISNLDEITYNGNTYVGFLLNRVTIWLRKN